MAQVVAQTLCISLIYTYRIRSFNAFRLSTEIEVLFTRKHLKYQFPIEHSYFWTISPKLLIQQSATLFNFLARQIGRAFCGPLHHVGEADAVVEQLKVFFGIHLLVREPRQVQTLPEVIAGPGIVMPSICSE